MQDVLEDDGDDGRDGVDGDTHVYAHDAKVWVRVTDFSCSETHFKITGQMCRAPLGPQRWYSCLS